VPNERADAENRRAVAIDRRGRRISEMADEVAEKVISTLASVKRIPADSIKLDTSLQDLGIDSLDVFTLLFELENAFKISIPDDDVRSLKTVNDIVDGMKKIIAATPPAPPLDSATPAN
jgi:acyl carrier protein